MLHPNRSGALHDILEDYAKFHLGFCEMQMKLETAFNLADQIELMQYPLLAAFSFQLILIDLFVSRNQIFLC